MSVYDKTDVPLPGVTTAVGSRSAARENLLNRARDIVNGERDVTYGAPEDSFGTIAELWQSYLSARQERIERQDTRERDLGADDVAIMLALIKIARMATGGTGHSDNWVDLAGYAACGFEASHGSTASP